MKPFFFLLVFLPVFVAGQIGSSAISSSNVAETNSFNNATALPEILAVGKSSEDCCFPVSIIIPVELLLFEGKATEKGNQLLWITASEINNQGFELQRSRDAKSWKVLAFLKGAGTSLVRQNYSFIDESPLAGINYYRLKQLDFDGAYEYSEVVAVDMQQTKQLVRLQSNLVQDQLTIFVAEKAELKIVNAMGVNVQQSTIRGNSTIEVAQLAAGTYNLLVTIGGKTEVLRFVKL